MDVANSVRKAIDDWQNNEFDSAMLHACNSIDSTARSLFPNLKSKDRFTRCLRDNYFILEPMGAPGIDLTETRFLVAVAKPTAPGGKPDMADIIYGIHRCCHAHGDELPDGFDLIEDAAGPAQSTRMEIKRGVVRISDRMIFGLLAVSVLSPVNALKINPRLDGYYLTFGKSAKLMINEWWGRASDFPAVTSLEPMPKVKLDFSSWHL